MGDPSECVCVTVHTLNWFYVGKQSFPTCGTTTEREFTEERSKRWVTSVGDVNTMYMMNFSVKRCII